MADRFFYPLDGTWHKSVAAKMSALHLESLDPHTKGSALCNPMVTALYMEDPYTESEAATAGRTLCRRCLKLVSNAPSTRHHNEEKS